MYAVGAAITEPASAYHGLAARAATRVHRSAVLVQALDGRVLAQLHDAVSQRVELEARQQV